MKVADRNVLTDPCVSIPEIVEHTGYSRDTILAHAAQGRLRGFRSCPRGQWRFRRSQVEAWLESMQS